MAINETVTGDDAVAITGTASAGEKTIGVQGVGDSTGVRGEGKNWNGVEGISTSTIGGFGVFGANTAGGTGVAGESTGWMGVYGKSESTTGGAGVMGEGVGTGVLGRSINPDGTTNHDGVAGSFDGNVLITGKLAIQGADLLEAIADMVNGTGVNPLLHLDDEGAKIGISGSGFSRLGLVHITCGYQIGNESISSGRDTKTDINGQFAAVDFPLTGGTQAKRIEVRADDLRSAGVTDAQLRFP